jgi:uncharacterized membrane protein
MLIVCFSYIYILFLHIIVFKENETSMIIVLTQEYDQKRVPYDTFENQ